MLDRYCTVELEFWEKNHCSVNISSVLDSVFHLFQFTLMRAMWLVQATLMGKISLDPIYAHRMFTGQNVRVKLIANY